MPAGFHWLIAAQFLSALADNALLIVTIALLQEQGMAGWWAPLLKFALTIAYVLLAPAVGPLADAVPKGRLMTAMNATKTLGVVALFMHGHPVLAFAIVGLGAAGYAPAKYGLVTELVGPTKLVAANSWIEVSVVCAVLLGTVLGGGLVSDALRHTAMAAGCQALAAAWGVPLSSNLTLSLLVLLCVYAASGLLQWGVPDSRARYPQAAVHPVALLRNFVHSNRTLWRDADGGLSLAVTTLFWGVGATLQFTVLGWAHDTLGLPLAQAAYLQGVVALGVVAGAALAGRLVPLHQAKRVLPAGVVLGLLISTVAITHSLWLALPLLVLVGLVGGILVVPMNALLQHRGHQLLTAGRSIAVQGYNENLSILVMLASYAGLLALNAPIVPLMTGFGLVIATAMAALLIFKRGLLHARAAA
ncbi:MAG: lysophospholipid transporter LplT [Burkholderiales bacterium]|nr:lysophospholipid transporter LplT [Burkholderiales bacterium]